MKKFVVLVTLICVISLCLLLVLANEKRTETPVKLSEILSSISEEERAEFLSSMNIVIPEELKDADIVAIISDLEENPDMPFIFGWTKLYDLCEDLRTAVKKYYGIQDETKAQ